MDIKVMKLLFFILCISIDKMYAFNHSMAEAECTAKNGLASYKHFVGDQGRSVENDHNLKEGESAWISGNVKFSRFVSYYGCFSEGTNGVYKNKIEDNSIYSCLQNCKQIVDIMFIGLRNEFCFCANKTDINSFIIKSDIDCNQYLVYSNIDSTIFYSSGGVNISMFQIVNHKSLNFVPPFSEPRSQCVTVRSDGNTTRYESKSCYSKANSFICLYKTHRFLPHEICDTYYSAGFCVFIRSYSWITSFKECSKYNGKLTHFLYAKMKGYMAANRIYWTGIFRTFEIVDKNLFSGRNVCLSVKKVNGKIVFDPADCSTKKKFICETLFSKTTESTNVRISVDAKTNLVSVSKSFTTKVVENTTIVSTIIFLSSEAATQTENEDNELNLIVVCIAVGAVVTVSLMIFITCIILRKRNKLKTNSTQNRSKSKDHVNNTTNKTLSGSIPDVAKTPELAQSVEDEVTYAIPDTAKKHSPLSDSEYDSIRVKCPGEQKGNKSKVATIEDHVYGFHSANPIDIDIEVYDHVEAARNTNISKPTDGIYNTLAEDSETYNVLGHGNKEESTKSGVNRTQIKETCPTYDKLK